MTLRFLGMATCCVVAVASCQRPGGDPESSGPDEVGAGSGVDPVDARCVWPSAPRILREEGPAVLLEWQFPDLDIYSESVIPPDSAYLAFRAAVRADSADLRNPIADAPQPKDQAEADLWRDEDFNHELAQSGAVGTIEGITCLDALLFAHQNARMPELTHPTEFVASVLRREVAGRSELAVVFGAGDEMFVPKSVYGFDVVSELRDEGWEYWYAIHNHTVQRNGDRIALGRPTLSTSDVQLTRNLAEDRGLKSARVTNGFFTFRIPAQELPRMRSR